MSKTKRRKKDKAPTWVTQECERVDPRSWGYVWVELEGKERKKEVSKWHSDAGYHGDYGDSPGWFVHEYMEVPFRVKSRQALRQVLRLVDYEDADVPTIFKKPQEYYW